MSKLMEPPPVKLFMSLIFDEDFDPGECVQKLRERLGEIEYRGDVQKFDRTGYYEREMGDSLYRRFITFRKLIGRAEIAGVKSFTNNLEKVFSYEGRRRVNIDPGYIAQEHLILATGKGYSHRPYLGLGVYADLTLVYEKDNFRTLDWTYPDYGHEETRALFKRLRADYTEQLKKEGGR